MLTPIVIQTTVGRKNLGNIHFIIPRFFASLNDKMFQHQYCLPIESEHY